MRELTDRGLGLGHAEHMRHHRSDVPQLADGLSPPLLSAQLSKQIHHAGELGLSEHHRLVVTDPRDCRHLKCGQSHLLFPLVDVPIT